MKKFFLIVAVLTAGAVNLTFENQVYIVPAAWALIFFTDRTALRILANWKFSVFLLLLVGGCPMVLGERSGTFLGIAYSRELFQINAVMAQRSLIILFSVRLLTGNMSPAWLTARLEKIGWHRLSAVYGAALTLLPEVRTLGKDMYAEFRERRKNGLKLREGKAFIAFFLARLILYDDARSYSARALPLPPGSEQERV